MAQPGKNRSRLQGAFMHALAEDFESAGRAGIAKFREKHPDRYYAIIASLMPKEVEISRPLDDLTDEQLAAALEAARALAGAGATSAQAAGAGDSAAGVAQPAPVVPAVPETI